MKTKIYIQVWQSGDTRITRWDDVTATIHEVENPKEAAQAVADATGKMVRMTYHMDGVKVGSLNGAYIHPTTIAVDPTKTPVLDEKKHSGHNAYDRENNTY